MKAQIGFALISITTWMACLGGTSGNKSTGGISGLGGRPNLGGEAQTGGAVNAGGGMAGANGPIGQGGSGGGAASNGGMANAGASGTTGGMAGTNRNGGAKGGDTTGTGGATLPDPTRDDLAGPMLRVDFDISGRPVSEVSEPGYAAWVIPNVSTGTSASTTIEGVKFTLAMAGANGTGIKSDWHKLAVQIPNYARLVGDGVTVAEGNAGAEIQLTIGGLAAGKHSFVVYLNQTANVASAAPIDISVDGITQATGVVPSIQVLSNAAAKTAYLPFEAQAGKDVVISFKAQTSSNAATKNVMINGFELDVPNPANQATQPMPANGDEHVDCDSGSVTLSWKAATGAVSHDVYVGTDLAEVRRATHASPTFKGNQSATSYTLSGINSLKTYYWRIDEITTQKTATTGTLWLFRPRHLAFPTAEGYGRYARGGRGGVVVHVTNLNDSGPGSLRDAVTTDRGPRVIVFDVSGIIKLASRLTINQNYITVAGQTAPGKGIVIRSAPFGASGVRDLIIQHVRVRLGGGTTFDGMGLQGSDYSIVDHCSISWTIDEGFSSRSGKNITLQRTMISECLNIAGHANYPAGSAHGFAGSISGDIGSFHHNLLAHCAGRNWSLAGGLDGAGEFAGRLDIFNTVVYNWDYRTTDGGAHQVNFVNNYYKPGAATSLFVALNAQYEDFPGKQQYYVSGNVMPGRCDESSQESCRKTSGSPKGYNAWVSSPFFPSHATLQSAKDAYKDVLSDVGMTQPVFDEHDQRIIKETLNGTYTYKGGKSGKPGLPDHEEDVGGYEAYPNESRPASWDSDGDGLPDWWEKLIKSDPNSPKDNFTDSQADPDGDGYTQLDDYFIWMSKPHFFTSSGASITLDLTALFSGYTASPSYSSSAAVNGAVAISGKTATFKASGCGLASWNLTVKDSEGSTKTIEMVAFSDAAEGSTCP